MINSVTIGGPIGDPPERHPREEAPHDGRGQASTEDGGGQQDAGGGGAQGDVPDHRLVVEHDEAKGVLTYRWVDRKSGAVVSELTRDDLKKLRADPAYHAGAWLNTKA
jgi:hypothetical protein